MGVCWKKGGFASRFPRDVYYCLLYVCYCPLNERKQDKPLVVSNEFLNPSLSWILFQFNNYPSDISPLCRALPVLSSSFCQEFIYRMGKTNAPNCLEVISQNLETFKRPGKWPWTVFINSWQAYIIILYTFRDHLHIFQDWAVNVRSTGSN